MYSDSARRLISLLSRSLDIGVPVRTLPEDLRDADLLTICDADGLIEFGRRRHCYIGREARPVLESGWEFGSVTGPNTKPMASFLKEVISGDQDRRIEVHVRLTHKGRIMAARASVGGGAADRVRDRQSVDQIKPSHAKARSLYWWAMEHIDGADAMTYAELFAKLVGDPRCGGEGLPGSAATFGRYCRAAGIRRNNPPRAKSPTRSIRRSSEI